MKSLFVSTPGGKAGALDGLNLFFGALLGANLGTLDPLALEEYVKLVILLAGTVVTLRMVSTSERRLYVLVVLAIYAALLVALVTIPGMRPEGMAAGDLHRLVATLAVWVLFVLMSEFSPVREAPAPPPPPAES
jgi:hypothetical protein